MALISPATSPLHGGEIPIYIGTYTKPGASQGIYQYGFDVATGEFTDRGLAVESVSPSFLVRHPNKKFVYAVNEVEAGAVSAFAVEAGGKLRELNHQSSLGSGPTHISIDRDGRNVLIANYGGGSVAALPIAADGSLKPANESGFVQHRGSGPDQGRQEGPHAHSIYLDPAGTHAFACDLGLDKIFVYRFDPAKGSLNPSDPPFAATAPGAGPRHLAMSAKGDFLYCGTEMANTVQVFARPGVEAILKDVQTISTLPDGYKAKTSIAEVIMHPNGQYLYVSNRGHDTIAQFSIDAATGKLTPVGWTPTGGKNPRYFGIDPSGAAMIVANQDSDNLVSYRLDPKTGVPTPTGKVQKCFSPVCVLFAP